MRYWIALCLALPVLAMDLTIQSGKEDGSTYSVLHLRHNVPFSCEATDNEFGDTQRIVCSLPTSPKQSFPPIDNVYLSVTGTSIGGVYRITILPKAKMKLIPVVFNLSKETQTYQSDVKNAKHWSVVGYSKHLPLLELSDSSPSSINFPVKVINKNFLPYVGGLDLKGNPIKITRVQDVTDYMEMKKAYAAKNYDKVLSIADDTLKSYPNTVFKSELMVYQIRALHQKDESEKLLEVSKRFMRDYSGDQNVAEILAYTANAYNKIGQNSDADYFFERLFDEQADSRFASVGMLYKAQQLETSGDIKKAMSFYQKALATSGDVTIASQAAFRLAQLELGAGHTKKAAQFVDKIANANAKYFGEDRENSMKMSDTFNERNDPATASRITESLLDSLDQKSPDRELLLRNMGLQLAKNGKKSEALKRFNEYLSIYKYGEYISEIQHAKDGLFFDEGDKNSTVQMKKYDDLIDRYGNDSVGRKALYKKAQLLLEQKKYQSVLDMESDLYRLNSAEYPQTNNMIAQSAIGLVKNDLKEGKCVDAMNLQKMYKVRLLSEWDPQLFNCALKTTQYSVAKKIAQSHLKSKSVPERQVWLYRMVKTEFGLGEYKEAIKGGEELITLLGLEKNPPLNDIYRTMYDAAQRVGDDDAMIRHIKAIEGAYGVDFNDIERYTQMVGLGLKRRDEGIVQNYGRKVAALQERTKTYTQSPFIEFTLAQSYQNLSKDTDALAILKTLDKQKLTTEKRSRQQYLIGAIEQKLGHKRESRDAFNASIKADKNSAWSKLAKDALGLL